MISAYGGFVEVYVSTPVEVCEQRDRKGLYAKARAGLVTGFTGVDDPYDVPEEADVVIDASQMGPQEGVEQVLSWLRQHGYFGTV